MGKIRNTLWPQISEEKNLWRGEKFMVLSVPQARRNKSVLRIVNFETVVHTTIFSVKKPLIVVE